MLVFCIKRSVGRHPPDESECSEKITSYPPHSPRELGLLAGDVDLRQRLTEAQSLADSGEGQSQVECLPMSIEAGTDCVQRGARGKNAELYSTTTLKYEN